MHFIDWLLVALPLLVILWVGFKAQSYIRNVSDFLSAGRLCGRYLISIADIANGLSIMGLVAFVEVHYRTGFALTFWQNLTMPLGVVLSLTGFVTYRFRETKAMSFGQYIEMRYSRKLRIFASALRSHLIFPASVWLSLSRHARNSQQRIRASVHIREKQVNISALSQKRLRVHRSHSRSLL